MDPDLVLRGGTVVDGTGAAPYAADVGVVGGRVAVVEAWPGALRGARTIDCDGLVVSPGFVDLHSHADFTVPNSPSAATALAQGVTTLVVGNCGFAPFPVGADDPAALRAQSGFLSEPMSWDWRDAAGYVRAVEAVRPAVHIALQVGHHALRAAVVGDAARAATTSEIAQMCALLDVAADQGVYGFSTGLIYAPGRFAEPDEIQALAGTAARRGLLYSTHVRDETSQVVAAVGEAIDVAERTGVRLEVSHLKAMGRAAHGRAPELLGLLDAARSRGVDVAADVYPYTASSTTLSSRLPGWALDGGAGGLVHRLGDPSARAAVVAALRARVPDEVDPAGIMLAGLPPGRYREHVGLRLDEIARRVGRDPVEVIVDVLAEHRAQVSIVNHSMTGADVQAVLTHPQVSVASDGAVLRARPDGPSAGLPHPRSFGTFASVLGHHVRERAVLSLPEAVRKMTALPASRIGLTDRGTIAPGQAADLAVWDADRVASRSTYADPWHLATGVEHVLVGGVPAWTAGEPTTTRTGRVLRRTPTGGHP